MRTINAVLLAGCLAVFLALLVASLPTVEPGTKFEGYQICGQNEQTKEKECATYSLAPFVFVKVFKLLSDYNAVITAIATVLIARFTLTLKRSTDKLWDAGERQLRHLQTSAERQLRAYLSVIGTTGIYQEIAREVVFEGRGGIVNQGQTPAHKLTYWAHCDILDVPLPEDFGFPPPETIVGYSKNLGASDALEMNALLVTSEQQTWTNPIKRFVPEEEVADIKSGRTRALYTWGVVSYEDIFKVPHQTKFCFWYVWHPLPNGGEGIKIFYAGRHNEAD